MAWRLILGELLPLLKIVAEIVRDRVEWRKAEGAGRTEAIAEGLRDATRQLQTALDARRAHRDRLRDDPDSLRDDDGFRRD